MGGIEGMEVIQVVHYLLIAFTFFLQVCFIFEAILVAARIDVYGIIYVVILGLMLIAPRTLLAPVWLLFLVLHGAALIMQYTSLVGLPPSLICREQGNVVAMSMVFNKAYCCI